MTFIALLRSFLKRAPVTLAITLACVVVFFGEGVDAGGYNFIAGSGRTLSPLLEWGVLSTPAVADGEWWRLIAAGFLHFGVIHLVLNMYALLAVGLFIEPLYGRRRYAAIYAISLLAGNVVADLTQGPLAVSAGASGAIMGAFGAMAIVGLRYRIARGYLRSALFPIGATLLYGLASPGISNAAHLGGLIGGTAAALLLNLPPEVARRARLAQEQQAAARARAVAAEASPDAAWPAEVVDNPANRRELRAAGSSGWRRRLLALALGLFGLALAGTVALSLLGGEDLGAWQPLVAIGGLICLAWAYELGRAHRDALRLSPLGFVVEGRSPLVVRWRDVRGFGFATLPNGRTAVVFTRAPANRGESPDPAAGPRVEVLPATYGLPADQLVALLEQWRGRWTRSDRGSVV